MSLDKALENEIERFGIKIKALRAQADKDLKKVANKAEDRKVPLQTAINAWSSESDKIERNYRIQYEAARRIHYSNLGKIQEKYRKFRREF